MSDIAYQQSLVEIGREGMDGTARKFTCHG